MVIQKKYAFLINLVAIMLYMGLFVQNTDASDVKKIFIVPFSFNSGEGGDLIFLKKGIDQMLQTRLRHVDKTDIIFPKQGDVLPSDPIEAGKRYQSDYVLTGSITLFGDKVSTDALFFSVEEKKQILSFGEFGKTKGDVIEHINNLASKINRDVFGIIPYPSDSVQQNTLQNSYGAAAVPNFGSRTAFEFQSPPIDDEIISIAVGDVNGDKANEIIYATSNTIRIIAIQDGKQVVIAEKDVSGFSTILRVDVCDLNKNGIDEIIVTATDSKQASNISLAFEMDSGKTFKKIPIPSNYFYTVMPDDQGKPILVAQARENGKAYKKGIFQVEYQDNGYVISDKEISAPAKSNIYSFTSGTFYTKNTRDYAVYSNTESIQILDNSLQEQWMIDGDFGKSIVSFDIKPDMERKNEREANFIQQRMFISDMDRDGKNDLVVVKNTVNNSGILTQLRSITRGQIQIFSRGKESGMVKVWESRSHTGAIMDMNIGDVNNDGKKDLVYAVTTNAKTNILQVGGGKPKSYIFVKGF